MTSTIDFPYNARQVFTAVRWTVTQARLFGNIRCDEGIFRIKASHGLPIVGENIEIRVVATSTQTARVEIRSVDKLFYNIFKWGNNKENIGNITGMIQNEIYRYLSVVCTSNNDNEIRISAPKIQIRQ